MAIPYDYYRIFYYVAQHKSFTKVAEALGNNQPNITRCMNNLEQDLGCKLFVRTNHGVSLTPEGQRLYSRAAVAFEQLRLGESELRADCSLRTGSISIAASEAALHLTLLDRLDAFHRRNPGIHLRITNDSTPRAMEGLLRGQVDCAAITTPCPVRKSPAGNGAGLLPGDPDLRFGFHDLAAETRSLRDLENLPFVCMSRGTSTYTFYQQLFLKHNLAFHVEMEAGTMDQVLAMVQSNLGVGFIRSPWPLPPLPPGRCSRSAFAEPIPNGSLT